MLADVIREVHDGGPFDSPDRPRAPVSTSSRPTADNGRPRVGPFNATNIRSVVASNGRSEFRYIANVVKNVADIGT